MNIKGKEYKVKLKDNYFLSGDCAVLAGEIDYEEKEITIATHESEAQTKKYVYHELVHGYLHESGLTNYAHNEDLVEWIAQHIDDIAESGKEIMERVKEYKAGYKKVAGSKQGDK